MSKLTDRVSYLRGLAEGMKLNTEKDANKLLLEVLAVLSDVAEAIESTDDRVSELDSYVESIDDDLADLEDTLFGDDLDDEDDDEDDEDGDSDELISYACPHCGHELEFLASDVDFDEDYLCPVCGKSVFPELEDDEDEEEDDEEADAVTHDEDDE
ncbi:MAG: hypothetical protein Q4E72_10395 [bacterium]|nr:hypothetical protein [bacterium]